MIDVLMICIVEVEKFCSAPPTLVALLLAITELAIVSVPAVALFIARRLLRCFP